MCLGTWGLLGLSVQGRLGFQGLDWLPQSRCNKNRFWGPVLVLRMVFVSGAFWTLHRGLCDAPGFAGHRGLFFGEGCCGAGFRGVWVLRGYCSSCRAWAKDKAFLEALFESSASPETLIYPKLLTPKPDRPKLCRPVRECESRSPTRETLNPKP